MYKADIPSPSGNLCVMRVFVKLIPINVWSSQWEQQNKWRGEFVTDGENFVMEAAALAFLQREFDVSIYTYIIDSEYCPELAPRLLGVLEVSINGEGTSGDQEKQCISHVALVSELYGEDLLDLLERRERSSEPVSSFRLRFCVTLLV